MSGYNYPSFPLDLEQATFAAFRELLHPGETAPEGQLVDAATGETAPLADLWADGPAVLEFGSIT